MYYCVLAAWNLKQRLHSSADLALKITWVILVRTKLSYSGSDNKYQSTMKAPGTTRFIVNVC